jgi:hypothetical protein
VAGSCVALCAGEIVVTVNVLHHLVKVILAGAVEITVFLLVSDVEAAVVIGRCGKPEVVVVRPTIME